MGLTLISVILVDGLFDEAAVEIAQQIRLRGMSGLILIDLPRAGSGK